MKACLPGAAGLCIAATILCAAAAPARAQERDAVMRPRSVAEDLQMFSQVLNQIRLHHPDSVDLHELFMSAIEGMILAVDPHSYVLPARRLAPEKEKAAREGKLHPVPIHFTYVGSAPVVVSVGAVAAGLDILPGDELIAIDGEPVHARSADELDIVLGGNRGSKVALTFERQRVDGSTATLTRTVAREKAQEGTAVPVAFLLDDRTGYVRITHFLGDRVADDLRRAITSIEERGAQRLILDLRGNPGGDPEAAARIAGEFLPRGAVVYVSESRHDDLRRTVKVERSFLRPGGRTYPLVVLVDHATASAAELLAGALQDHDRAVIVGRPTFGKALLMRGMPLADGSVVVLVVGHLKTPCGRSVQRQYRGVPPREYYRMARGERETAGLPSCTTAGGRTVFGGDGIRPDITLPSPSAAPAWVAQLYEADLPLRWVGSFLESGAAPPALEPITAETRPPASATAEFRAFAGRAGVEIPADADAERRLEILLLRTIVTARWGAAGRYRFDGLIDPAVQQAVAAFDQAERLLGR